MELNLDQSAKIALGETALLSIKDALSFNNSYSNMSHKE